MPATITRGPYLLWHGSKQATVWWETDMLSEDDSIVVWRTTQEPVTYRSNYSTIIAGGFTRYVHAVHVFNLLPGTTYYYRIRALDYYTGTPYVLQTLDATSVSVGVFGGSEYSPSTLSTLLTAADAYLPGAYLSTGGVVEDGRTYEGWDRDFWTPLASRLATKGLSFVRGPTEGTGQLPAVLMPTPTGDLYNEITLGPIRCVFLDTSRPKMDQKQLEWASKAFRKNEWKSASYRVIVAYNPFRTALWRNDDYGTDGSYDYPSLYNVISSSGTDLAIHGCAHNYQRGAYYTTRESSTHRVHHIVTSGAGAAIDDVAKWTWLPPEVPNIQFTRQEHNMVVLTTNSAGLTLRAIGTTGAVIDTVSIAPHTLI